LLEPQQRAQNIEPRLAAHARERSGMNANGRQLPIPGRLGLKKGDQRDGKDAGDRIEPVQGQSNRIKPEGRTLKSREKSQKTHKLLWV
jgi:hypothetical protein